MGTLLRFFLTVGMHPFLGALLGLSTLACGAGWHQPPPMVPGALKPRQQVQVWSGGQAARWHGVVVRADSISGVPFMRPLDCDSCRRALPRASVDSVRLGNPVAGFWKTFGLVVGVPFALLVLYCWDGCFPET